MYKIDFFLNLFIMGHKILGGVRIHFEGYCRHTRTYRKNPPVKISHIEAFMVLEKIAKIGSRMRFFLSSASPNILVTPIFKRFLIELKCLNFECRFQPPICMRLSFKPS